MTTTPSWIEGLLNIRYPPYSKEKFKKLKKMTELKPDFDRNGNPTGGLVWWTLTLVLGLGGKGTAAVTARWAFVAFLAVALRLWGMRN